MESLGYIPLTKAEEISGIKADTLKKRCQEGKIPGAVKHGKTWFVPKREIVKLPDELNNDLVLETLVRMAEANTVMMAITIFVKGMVISGRLTSMKDYLETTKRLLNDSPMMSEQFRNFLDTALFEPFSKRQPKDAVSMPISFIHIKNPNIYCTDGRIINLLMLRQ